MPLSSKQRKLKTRNALIESKLGIVYRIVDSLGIRRGSALYDDVHGAGCIALVLAADRYDPSRGVDFATFAWPRVSGACQDELSRRAVVHTPPKVVRQNIKAGQRGNAPEVSTSKYDAEPGDGEGRQTAVPAPLVDDSAQESLEHQEQRNALYAALELLPDEQRDVLLWHLDRREQSPTAYARAKNMYAPKARTLLSEALTQVKALICGPQHTSDNSQTIENKQETINTLPAVAAGNQEKT